MGIIFSRFRKKSSVKKLEEIEEEIKELKEDSADTERRHRKITRHLMSYSSLLCISLSVLLYFYYPSKLQTKLTLIGLLLLSPLLYYIMNRIISWYYKRKIKSSHSRLNDLKKEKKRLLDEIMENETYKVAKDILEKYAPETLPEKNAIKLTQLVKSTPAIRSNSPSMLQPSRGRFQHISPSDQRNNGNLNVPGNINMIHQGPPPRMPSAPILASKNYLDKFFDYIIGDGPNNRYALICSHCSTHNGLALMEEFEYTAFRCYACHLFNPARKQRPAAPKLDIDKSLDLEKVSDSDSGSEDGSNEDFETEKVEHNLKTDENKEDVESDPSNLMTATTTSAESDPTESSIRHNVCDNSYTLGQNSESSDLLKSCSDDNMTRDSNIDGDNENKSQPYDGNLSSSSQNNRDHQISSQCVGNGKSDYENKYTSN